MTQDSQENKYRLPRPLIGFFGVMVLLFIGFVLGQSFERVRFRHNLQWRQNYQNNFFGKFQPREMRHMVGNFAPRPMRSHGILGKVLSVEESNFIVQDEDGNEQSIRVDDKTIYRFDGFQSEIPAKSDIKIGNRIAVFGRPTDEGQIYATLIRIFSDNNMPAPSVKPVK